MTSRAEQARARADRINQAQQASPEDRPTPRLATTRVKPVRRTVDLPPTRHAALTEWCGETAVELGVARVTGQDVLAALVRRLLTDETLRRKIKADLEEDLTRR